MVKRLKGSFVKSERRTYRSKQGFYNLIYFDTGRLKIILPFI